MRKVASTSKGGFKIPVIATFSGRQEDRPSCLFKDPLTKKTTIFFLISFKMQQDVPRKHLLGYIYEASPSN